MKTELGLGKSEVHAGQIKGLVGRLHWTPWCCGGLSGHGKSRKAGDGVADQP